MHRAGMARDESFYVRVIGVCMAKYSIGHVRQYCSSMYGIQYLD